MWDMYLHLYAHVHTCIYNNIALFVQMHTHIKQNPKAHTHANSPNDHATHTAPHISPAMYLIRRARSGRVRLQQRQHHLWPGLVLCCTVQRQASVLRKRRHRATSARHTRRQAGRQTVAPLLCAAHVVACVCVCMLQALS